MTFVASMQVLMHAYPRWDLSKDAAMTWAALLADIPPDALHLAAQQIARESKFPPSVAEWRERALTLVGRGKAFETVDAEGWAELMANRMLHSRQRYESRPERRKPYAWSSESVRRAAELVDWSGDWEGEAKGTIRAQFRDALRNLQTRDTAIQAAQETIRLDYSRERLSFDGDAP